MKLITYWNVSKMQLMVYVILSIFMTGCGSKVFYAPRPYDTFQLSGLVEETSIEQLSYTTGSGNQTAFYLKPRKDPNHLPKQVWILFAGLNSLALEWQQWFVGVPGDRIGILLVDYPGYGLNEGVPRAKRIFDSNMSAVHALAAHLNVPFSELENKLALLGQSLGSGAALQLATEVKIERLVLISPFTNLEELTIHRFGKILGTVLNLINPEKYTNRQWLKAIANRKNPPKVIIIHGDQDKVIPVRMGRELASLFPAITTYYEIKDFGHADMFSENFHLIYRAMFGETLQEGRNK